MRRCINSNNAKAGAIIVLLYRRDKHHKMITIPLILGTLAVHRYVMMFEDESTFRSFCTYIISLALSILAPKMFHGAALVELR